MNYKLVYTDFWKDEKVRVMNVEERILYLYLLTNSYNNSIGIYKITKDEIREDMGYCIEKIEKMLEKLTNKYMVIAYSKRTNEVALKRWGKYIVKGGKAAEEAIKKDLSLVEDKSLVTYVALNVSKRWALDLYTQYCDEKLTYYDIKKIRFANRSNSVESIN